MRTWFAAASGLALAILAHAAAADEAPHSRASCPEGSTSTGGAGNALVCAPTNCTQDSDCVPGRVCRDRPLCVETRMPPGASAYKTAVGTCESGAKCTYPAECEEASKRCVRAGLAERYRSSCGCHAPGEGGDGAAVLAFGLALAAVWARRRRARA